MSNLSGGSAIAQEVKSEVEECITLCDEALESQQQVIDQLDLGLVECKDEHSNRINEVTDLQDKLDSPFRNPFIMGTIGVVLGIVVTGLATK